MRTDMDVDEARPEAGRIAQLGGQEPDRAFVELVVGPGQIDQVRGMDDYGVDPVLATPLPERVLIGCRRGAALPGSRVVAEDLEGGRADLLRPIRRLHHSVAERQVGAEASSVWEHRRPS